MAVPAQQSAVTSRVKAGSVRTKTKQRATVLGRDTTSGNRTAISRNRALRQKNNANEKSSVSLDQVAPSRTLAPAARTLGADMSETLQHARTALRVSEVVFPIFSVYWWVYAFQFLMALFFFFAAGSGMLLEQLAEDSLAATAAKLIFNLMPTGVLLGTGWLIASGIGLGFLFTTALGVYGVRVKNPWTWRTLVICAALQAAPFVFILPWPAIWIGAILYLETYGSDSHS